MAENNTKDQANKPGSKPNQIMKTVGTIGIAALQSPAFWKGLSKIIAKLNHPSWYGGSTNVATVPVGPYIKDPQYANKVIVAVTYVQTTPSALINLDMIKSQINTAINAFKLQMGYIPETLTYDNIINYLKKSMDYAAAFLSLRRTLNSRNVNIVGEHKFGDRLSNVNPIGHLSNGMFPAGISLDIANINNVDWLGTYASEMFALKLLPQHHEFLKYLYDGYYSNGLDSAVNTLVELYPLIGGGGFIYGKTWIDKALEDLTAVPGREYIEAFLENLGFRNIFTPDDVQRDLTQNTMGTFVDPSMTVALVNMFNESYSTNGLIVRYSNDIDVSFDTAVDSISVGEIGQNLKLNLMSSKAQYYSAFLKVNADLIWRKVPSVNDGSGLYVAPNWQLTTTSTGIQELSAAQAGATMSRLARLANALKIQEFMGIETFDTKVRQYSFDASKNLVPSAGDVDVYNLMVGSDIIQVTDVALYKNIITTNFTMPRVYLKELVKYIQDVSKSRLVK